MGGLNRPPVMRARTDRRCGLPRAITAPFLLLLQCLPAQLRGQTITRTRGNWCPECRLFCTVDNLPGCADWPGLAALRKERPPDWLEISRLCIRPKMPTNGEFDVFAAVTKTCDLASNESFYPRSSCREPGFTSAMHGGSPPSCIIDPLRKFHFFGGPLRGFRFSRTYSLTLTARQRHGWSWRVRFVSVSRVLC